MRQSVIRKFTLGCGAAAARFSADGGRRYEILALAPRGPTSEGGGAMRVARENFRRLPSLRIDSRDVDRDRSQTVLQTGQWCCA